MNKKMKKITLSLLSIAVLAGCGATSPDNKQENTAEAINNSYNSINTEQLIEHVKVLASDEFGGRAPSSEGEKLTLDYLTKEFKAIGFPTRKW